MIDVAALRIRYRRIAGFLDERGRRLFAANEALELGRGGVTAVSAASGIARSTINRGIAELKAGRNELGARIRRRGGGRKRAVEGQPGLLAALEGLIEGAIRGDPQSPLRWVSRSQRNIAAVLGQQGFEASGIDRARYPRGIKVSKAELAAIKIEHHSFHGEWNYTIKPNKKPN